MFPDRRIGAVVRPAASLYAVVKHNLALVALTSLTRITPPITLPGGKPVTADPGLNPRSPLLITVGPVLVTVEPAKIAKSAAQSKLTACRGTSGAATVLKTHSKLHLLGVPVSFATEPSMTAV